MSAQGRTRTEICSLRLSAEEKQRVQDAASRHGLSPSDFMRAVLMRHVDDPAVSPSQNITITYRGQSTRSSDDLLAQRISKILREYGPGNWL